MKAETIEKLYEKLSEEVDSYDDEPSYYNSNGLSPLKAFQKGLLSKEEYIGFLKGNIIKYTIRCDKKGNSTEDMDKCIDYCNHLRNIL